MSDRLRVGFMGTPDFAVPALARLIEAGHEIAAVYTQPPRPAGRGKRDRRSPVHEAAAASGLDVRHPRTLRYEAEQAAFRDLGLDVAVVAAYGLILPVPVLAAPALGCVNIHASLLPRWRGAAPIQRAIMAGDAETGVTIMMMEAGLDTGPMLTKAAVPIGPETTAGDLHDALSAAGADLIVPALAGIAEGSLIPEPQPEDGITYAAKIEKAEGRLDWRRGAAELDRHVRGLTPWPGAFFDHEGATVRVGAASPEGASRGHTPGTVLDDRPAIACGDGVLVLTRLQRPGGRPMAGGDFLRGYALPPGTVLPLPDPAR